MDTKFTYIATQPMVSSNATPLSIPVLMCAICDACFTDNTLWRSHTRNHFTNNTIPAFPCRLCHVQFPDVQQLQLHMSSHSVSRGTQTCDVDQQSFIKVESPTNEHMDYSHFDDFVPNLPADLGDDYDANDFKFDMVLVTEMKVDESPVKLYDHGKTLDRPCVVMIQRLDENVLKSYTKQAESDDDSTPDASENCSNCIMCGELVSNLFPSLDEANEELKRTKKLECRLCGQLIRDLSAMKMHHKRNHLDANNKLSTMVACDACLTKRLQISLIKNPTFDTRPFGCDRCTKRFETQSNLRAHLLNDHTDRCVFLCSTCPRNIIGRSRYNKHMYSHRSYQPSSTVAAVAASDPQQRFECAHCPKAFPGRNSILAHLKTHFPGERFACPLCPMTLKTAGNLKQHLWLHEGRKDVTCHVCGRMFLRKENWAFHMRSHTGEQPFACTICGKRFSGKANRNNHMRIHTGEKPFACTMCDKRYRDYSDLRRHKRVHGGVEKTHKCEICDKRYYEAKCLRAHRLSAHQMAAVAGFKREK